ncbi:MAG: DUF3696 domain-containing protein [Bacteroidales bacterium]|nr:DUF3696 domain-containing protein [Bacteroidales bacterium]
MNKMNNNPIFSIKNFRCFGNTNADFEIAPITILTGCNSSGKSSSVKAQLLLSGLMKRIDQNLTKKLDGHQLWNISPRELLSQLVLNISNKQYQLGRFDRVKNDFSDSEYIILSYKVFSEFLKKNVLVEMAFIGQDGEVINDAILHQITIKVDEIVLLSLENLEQEYKNTYLSPSNDRINYLCLMPSFERFMLFCIGEQAMLEDRSYDFYDSELSKEDIDKQIEIAKHWIKDLKLTKEEIDFYRNKKYTTNISPSFRAINDFLNKKTLYTWLPFFSETKNMSKQQVRSWLVEKAKSVSSEENIQPIQWANFFCDDFDASEYRTLTDYFLSLEKEALQNGTIDEAKNFNYPYIGVIVEGKSVDVSFLYGDESTSEEKTTIKENLSPRQMYEDNHSFVQIMEILDYIFLGPESISPFRKSTEFPNNYQVETRLKAFARAVIFETLLPDFLSDVGYVSSSSTTVRRLYDLNENDKIANSIVKLIDGEKQGFVGIDRTKDVVFYEKKDLKYVPKTFLNKWCTSFEMGDITVEGTYQGLGAFIYVEKNGRKRLMADEGYGITQLFSLILQIECCILNATRRQKLTGEWTYYGGDYTVEYEPQYICVEEPEIHLHPKFQSLLADMFVEAYQKYNIRFIIETHSEYLVRRLQVMIADKDIPLTPNEVSLNYVEKDETTGISTNRQIKILEDGRLSEPFGTGFFDESKSLVMQMMKF